MLRPQIKTHVSHSGNARSPSIRPTDDDHPLLPHIPTIEAKRIQSPVKSTPSDLVGASDVPAVIVTPHAPHEPRHKLHTGPSQSKDLCDTEVYVHEVTKTDTLPRIVLQYKIPIQILRRSNKLWANDSIQYKNTLLLPVLACDIRPDLIEDLPSSLLASSDNTQSTSLNLSAQMLRTASSSSAREIYEDITRSSSPFTTRSTKKEKVKNQSGALRVTRQVYIGGVGLVDVAVVPSSILSYFPPSRNPPPPPSNVLDVPHYRDNSDPVRTSSDARRSSFEVLRTGAGQFAADAYNGTQGLIRRLKDKKNASEIDLIEF